MVGAYRRWLETLYGADRMAFDPPPAGECVAECADRTISGPLWEAEVAVRKGHWGAALALLQRGMALGWASGTPLDVAHARRVLAGLLVQVGAYQEAADHVDEALATFARAQWKTGLADGHWLAGEVFLAQGRHELAVERYDQAWTLGSEVHAIPVLVRAQIGLGKLAAARARWRDGKRLGTEARARATQAGLASCVLSARLALARTYLGCGEWRLAQRQAWRALEGARALNFAGDMLEAASLLGESLLGLGEDERARHYFREACQVAVGLADTLPPVYARTFWERAAVAALRDRLIG
jgi:tetratricopeptide (TPR) repeat protein